MLPSPKHFLIAILLLAIFKCSLSAHSSKSYGSVDSSTVSPTTPHPIKTKLKQLKEMEESALMGWYDMVNNFLVLIKPDQKTLDYVIDFISGKHELDPQETVFKIAKMNYIFLTMIIIGIVYVCVMLISGIFFLCCRFCGRCGAKDSQRQRRSDNCWRTMHKFCLILMIAFLVVPITCMSIINEHMKNSSPAVKGNATEVLDILSKFANDTDEDVDRISKQPFTNNMQNFDNFKQHFVELVHENITNSIDHEKLEEIKNIVSWVLTVEDQHAAIVNASVLSKAVRDLKNRIAFIREQTQKLPNCTDSKRKLCQLKFKQLPLENINVDEAYVNVQSEFQKLLKQNFEELKSVIDKIQNNTILRNKIEEESETLRRFANEANSNDNQFMENMKKEVKHYTDMLRKFADGGKRNLQHVFAETDGYELYRWWGMFGVAVVLLIPVAFLSIGLICGCCGYEKERHPTKRSNSSNCGGLCLILAVYYFFLISSALMLVTMFLFVIGGNIQTFVCIPLYQENFEILDQMKSKLNHLANGSIFQDVQPSNFLNDCHEDKSIIFALGLLNESDPSSYEKLISQSNPQKLADNDEVDQKLKSALLEITSGIREKLHQFFNALNLKEMKDIPNRLQDMLTNSKANLSAFIEEVKAALMEEPNENTAANLQFVNESAANLFEFVDDFEKKLNNFSTPLLNIYKEADNYKDKIRDTEKSLDMVEERLPKVIKAHLFEAVVSSTGMSDTVQSIGKCLPVWVSFVIARTVVCEFVVYPINGFWFGLGWALAFIIPTILFSVKLSRYYLRMKYDDDPYIHDSGESIPLEDMSRTKPFSYTNPGAMSWIILQGKAGGIYQAKKTELCTV
ncbi:prominin-1-like isoform X2 [Uloborus diversus]|uniref:prominin-1-like isoform X2 n=1 Tax=Uloborus diversus TaxID=327109 RepID=UPI0024091702|nr:prominin-1-like isoform X2 [Uloborus diversus]